MVPPRVQFGQSQDAASPGTADVEVNRLIGVVEQLARRWQLQRQLEAAAEGIDVLARRSSGIGGGILHQQPPAGGVAMKVSGSGHPPDFPVAEGTGHWQVWHHRAAQVHIAIRLTE